MSAIAEAGARPAVNKWAATMTVMIGMMATVMTSTMINVAIPHIMGAFGVGQDRAHWLSTGFLAAMTVAMLLNAWFVRNLGPRNTYVLANLVFVGASVMGNLSPTFGGVIAARVVQGACAGLIQPLGLGVIFTAFPPAERGKAMGFFGMGVVVGPALGPLVGGAIVDAIDWRFVFLGALPLNIIAAALGAHFIPGRDGGRGRLNWASFALIVVAVASFLNGISSGQRDGWEAPSVLGLLTLAALATLVFIELESRTENPLLNVRLFTDRGFAMASLVGCMFGAGMFGTIYLVPIFVQQVQGFTASKAGLLLMIAGLFPVAMYPLAGWLAQRFHTGYTIAAGLALFGVSSLGLAGADADTGFWTLVGFVATGDIGLAFVFPPLMATALRGLAPALVAHGSGTLNFIRMIGGAVGVNTAAIVLERRVAFHADALAATQTGDGGLTRGVLDMIGALAGAGGVAVPDRLPLALDYLGEVVAGRAAVLAFQDCFLLLAVGFAVATVATLVLVPRRA